MPWPSKLPAGLGLTSSPCNGLRMALASPTQPAGGVALAVTPPKVHFRLRAETDLYAAKANSIVIRHISHHEIIAIVEIVSPGNKSSRHGLRAFVDKAVSVLRMGIHLVILDLFPPGPRDPQGIHKAIWDEFIDNDFVLPPDKPLTLASYIGGPIPEAFVEPTVVGAIMPEMPLFLTPEVYIPLPLEATYRVRLGGRALVLARCDHISCLVREEWHGRSRF